MRYLRKDIQEIVNKQGWDEQSVIYLLGNFIADCVLTDKLASYLRDAADEENTGTPEDDEDEQRCYCGHFQAEHSSGGCAGCDAGGKNEAAIGHTFVAALEGR